MAPGIITLTYLLTLHWTVTSTIQYQAQQINNNKKTSFKTTSNTYRTIYKDATTITK